MVSKQKRVCACWPWGLFCRLGGGRKEYRHIVESIKGYFLNLIRTFFAKLLARSGAHVVSACIPRDLGTSSVPFEILVFLCVHVYVGCTLCKIIHTRTAQLMCFMTPRGDRWAAIRISCCSGWCEQLQQIAFLPFSGSVSCGFAT